MICSTPNCCASSWTSTTPAWLVSCSSRKQTLNLPTLPITLSLFTCLVPPLKEVGLLLTALFASKGGTFLLLDGSSRSSYPRIQDNNFGGNPRVEKIHQLVDPPIMHLCLE